MKNYYKMQQAREKICEDKEKLAIGEINLMMKNGEMINIPDLVNKTGLSRGYFYNNKKVNEHYNACVKLQGADSGNVSRKTVLDKALKKEVEKLNRSIKKKDEQISELQETIERLNKQINKQDREFLESL